jgi:DNA polymerase-1
MLLQVHDELLFEVASTDLEAVKDMVRSQMERALQLRVPIGVDIGVGRNWYETKAD